MYVASRLWIRDFYDLRPWQLQIPMYSNYEKRLILMVHENKGHIKEIYVIEIIQVLVIPQIMLC